MTEMKLKKMIKSISEVDSEIEGGLPISGEIFNKILLHIEQRDRELRVSNFNGHNLDNLSASWSSSHP